ncbi:RodZ domain-containing protein [Chitinimonas koreensis]|uniref:RodZ domain-containing protein n=1 Tax=Chitinimonas koreensis TaxID=356302 RepID=UPI0003F6E2E6|nr:RodZ domain-containing protein [Chitinimonas koreensis]QNM95603.1 helix-turn-helix domain-containing protein [Chitinimonas koreensis]
MTPDLSSDPAIAPTAAVAAASPTPGAILAAHRKEAGLSLEEVAGELKLSRRQIEALEADDYGALPGNTFVRGFVRNYARFLKIDAQPLVQYLERHLPVEPQQAALPRIHDDAMPILRPGGARGAPPFLLWVLAGMVLAGLVVGGFWLLQRNGYQPELTLSTPPAIELPAPIPSPAPALADAAPTSVAPTPASADGPTLAPSPAALPTPAASPVPTTVPAAPTPVPSTVPSPTPAPAAAGDIRILARQDSWVSITDASGKRLLGELVLAGQTRTVGGTPPYRLRIGNGPNTELYYKGKLTDLAPYTKVDVANLELN